jgi:ribosomal protein S18 acetylase RimI-like enzyme
MSRFLDHNSTVNAGIYFAAPEDVTSILTVIRRAMTEYARNSGISDPQQLEALSETGESILEHINKGEFLVARRNWQIVGTALLDRSESPDLCYLRRFAVLPECMGSGIGKLLFRCAVQFLHSESCREIRLYTAYSNHPLIAFYKRLGFHLLEVDESGSYPKALLSYSIDAARAPSQN